MKHGYGLKLDGSCSQVQRRFLPMNVCTAYVTFDHASVNALQTGLSQWKNGTTRIDEIVYDQTVTGSVYNCHALQNLTEFNNYFFNKSEIDAWADRGYLNCSEDPNAFPRCELNFSGPKFKNNFAVIPLTQHKINPISKLKKGRLSYSFLDLRLSDNFGPTSEDPMEFSGVYPYTPDDSETIRKPAGWMYSNRIVPVTSLR